MKIYDSAKDYFKDNPMDIPEYMKGLIEAAWDNGYQHGYYNGFDVAQITDRGIIKAQQRFDEIDRGNLPDLDTSGPGSVSEMQKSIYEIVKPKSHV